MTANAGFCIAFSKVAELGTLLGAAPLNQFPACWEHQVDAQWWIAVNGHPDPMRCSAGVDVAAFHCYVQFDGWPAAVFNPYGGAMAAGEAANEDAFLAALDAAIAAAQGGTA